MKRILAVLLAALFTATVAFCADAPAPAPSAPAKPAVGTQAAAAPAKKAELIDINTATVDQLRTLSGIGEEYSKKIVAGRPFAKKDQLVSRKILPDAVYQKIKDLIIAKQPEKTKSADKK